MKTKKDYEDVWQQARFDEKIHYKKISGEPIEEKKEGFAREICLQIHHRYQGEDVAEHTVQSTQEAHQQDAVKKKKKSTAAEK